MKTNIITQNGNINFGSAFQNSHTSNSKAVGVNFSFGDYSCSFQGPNKNNIVEIEEDDQDEQDLET